jgi:hypothetical protein
MTTLNRSRQRPPFTVVRVRRIKHRNPAHLGLKPRREAAQPDLASLILYGQG